MSFYNSVKLWNNVSDNDLVCSSDEKKLKKSILIQLCENSQNFLVF